jgi:hypothetical protein
VWIHDNLSGIFIDVWPKEAKDGIGHENKVKEDVK